MKLTIKQCWERALTAHKEGKLQEAEKLYRVILKVQPNHPEVNHNLGLLKVLANKTKAAIPLLKSALEANPKKEQFWLSYIDSLIKENQFENAKKVLEKGKKHGLAGERFDELSQHLMLVRGNKSPSQLQLNNLIESYQNGQYGDAEKLAMSITRQFPEHQLAWKVLGAVFWEIGKKSEALKANQKAVKLIPQDAAAHFNLGITLKKLNRLEEAEASCRQAIALKPDYTEAHNNLGAVLQELDKFEEAVASYRQAIALKPDYAEAHYNLGATLQELSKFEEAAASYRQAIAFKADHTEAHDNLGLVLLRQGKHREGLEESIIGSGIITFDLNSGLSIQ